MELTKGTRALVTGASRGIGRVLARQLAERGCAVGLVSRGREGLEELAAELPGDGHAVLPADVGDRESIAAAVEQFGDVDVLVANAGVLDYGPFLDQPLDNAERMTRINWLGTVYTVHAALPRMVERRRGHVVIVSSAAALRTFPEGAVYGATKAAQRGFADGLRHELHETGVSVTTVFPGEVKTSIHDHQMDHVPDWSEQENRADPEELVKLIVRAIERDERYVHYPRNVRAMGLTQGISAGLADRMVRRVKGPSAAPRL